MSFSSSRNAGSLIPGRTAEGIGIGGKRLKELDGLRGGAALAVVIFHYTFHYNNVYGHNFTPRELTRFGAYGVNLFFIISGFVIFLTISRSKKPLDFVWSRFSRLYPVYWAALCLTFTIVTIFGLPGREKKISDFIANFTMIQGFLGFQHIEGAYWTLTLELAFYFWILVLFLLGQLRNIEKWLVVWVVLGASITFGLFELNVPPLVNKFLILQYIEYFAAGICFFKIKNDEANLLTYFLLFCCVAAIFMEHGNKTSVGLTSFFAIFYLSIQGKLRFLSFRPLVYLGSISYSLYLLHTNIGYVIINAFYANGMPGWFGIFTAFFTSLSLAVLLTHAIEKPCLEHLRVFYKKNKTLQRISSKLISPYVP